jgi:hypothetical protein
MKDSQDIQRKIRHLEETVGEIQHLLNQQGTLLKNTEKKLQEFQDTIYAMLIEERYPPKRRHRRKQRDEDSVEL